MKRTIITILATAAIIGTVAYALGRADREPEQTASTTGEAGHLDAHATGDEPILLDGAGHVHALVHRPDGSLLLGAHGGLFASADDGATWSPVDFDADVPSSDFMSLVTHPTQPDVLFAGGHGVGVVRSDDGGSTWTSSDAGIDGTDIHGLAINQRDPEYVYAYSVGHGVYSSVDGGDSWDRIDDGPDNPGVRSLAYMAVQTDMDRSMDSDNWGLLFAGTADGVHDSYSCFCGWRESSDQLGGMTTYSLVTTHEGAATMYAGTTDGVWKTTDEGQTWVRLEGIDGRVTAVSIDPDNADMVVAATEAGAVHRSTDAGANWQRQN